MIQAMVAFLVVGMVALLLMSAHLRKSLQRICDHPDWRIYDVSYGYAWEVCDVCGAKRESAVNQ